MRKRTKLVGPWRNIHTIVWVIGIAILFWTGRWWPGILILVGISALVEVVIPIIVPEALGPEPEPEPFRPEPEPAEEARAPAPSVAAASAPEPEYRDDLLPAKCPGCGAPIRGHEVEWTGPRSADCQYCGTSLPMRET
jgi:hypothetical protein